MFFPIQKIELKYHLIEKINLMHLPQEFTESIEKLLKNDFADFVNALSDDAPVSIHVNDKLAYQPSTQKVAWCENGYYLPHRPIFTADPLFHAGAYYVQEASSMFLEQVLQQLVPKNSIVLDLSAAPGGKSTHISQHLSPDGFLISNEIIRLRANILMENTIKWGNHNVMVTNNSPADFGNMGAIFDVLVIDAPCSGEGMFRKNNDAINEWSKENIAMCALRQKNIVSDAWNSLKQGGLMVYSTCTYNQVENEENVKWIENELGASFTPIETTAFPNIAVTEKGYRFFPHKTRGEGFFLSVLRKNTKTVKTPKISKVKLHNRKQFQSVVKIENSKVYEKMLTNGTKFNFFDRNGSIFALEKKHAELVILLLQEYAVLHFGINLGKEKRNNFIPDISLALSKQLNRTNFTQYDIDRKTALQYLHRDAIQLPADIPLGVVLLTYQNLPIGWVKNIGNRCNNMYPKEWRIRVAIS